MIKGLSMYLSSTSKIRFDLSSDKPSAKKQCAALGLLL
ncbi:Unknown protein sequence [Pseudomonas amygdali pv. lachrymans]|uniref:Uncharacterized protein n=1 Tax=Pseudomonas amygdali pv. lachrymans TaxID=53707 RepID=A0ABR5KR37_PSEAV|nr:Unknown protein sequence [Pseudomonas amygdali pv. lachrymans]KPC18230.1 Unknown protein sequence [Pseudomonas amygdali pv. lachrymans]